MGVGLTSERGYGTAAAITVAIIWGLSFVAASMVLTTLSPVILATVRFIIAAAIYSPVIVWEYRRGNRPSIADLKELALFGFLSISIYFWLQYTGVQYAGAGVSAVLVTGLIPVLTGLAGAVLLKERFNLKKGLRNRARAHRCRPHRPPQARRRQRRLALLRRRRLPPRQRRLLEHVLDPEPAADEEDR